jgi:hypothetical protein
MADEILYSTIGDLVVAEVLHKELSFLLHDPTDLRVTMTEMPWSAMNTTSMKVGQITPNDVMTAPGEFTDPGNTALTDDSYNLTIAQYRLIRAVSDLAQVVNVDGSVNIALLAQLMVESANRTLTSMLTALFTSLSNTVGTTTVNLDVDDIYDAMFQLTASLAQPPFYCVLYPVQYTDFQSSLRGEGGAVQFQSATADMLNLRGPGFKGTWNNIEFWTSDTVPTANAGADSNGAMYSKAAFTYAEADIVAALAPYVPKYETPMGLKILVEEERDARKGMTDIIGHYYPAVSEALDGAGVGIVTDR